MHTPDQSATALGALVCSVWLAFLLGWLVTKSRTISETVEWFRRQTIPVRVFAVCALLAVVAVGGNKGGGNAPQSLPRPPLLLQMEEPAPAPAIAPVTVCTNGVTLRAESTNALEITAFRTVGGTELGDWIETSAPFFAIGTQDVSRCYVSASGSISFTSMRRPRVGQMLPDGTGLPALCPLRAPLGMVPEANWASAGAESRFWHDALPGGGRVLTWENALVDRLPGRRVTLQVELLPTGDSVFRYDFHDALNPPPTNFVMGAQMGTNAVNALSILGTNILAATVWNMDGAPVTNGVSIADLICTNGVLRTPTAFEIRWRNTTGIDPGADTDGDGLTNWAEIFLWGTYPDYADTDADGIADNVELMAGADPLDADEDGDGVPDGVAPAIWAANPLWATNSVSGGNVTIALDEPIPAGASATLVLNGLALPLRGTNTMEFRLPVGVTVQGRLLSRGMDMVKLSLLPPEEAETQQLLRSGAPSGDSLLRNDPGGVLDGNSNGGTFRLAIPEIIICNPDGTRAESECVHDSGGTREYTVRFAPNNWGLSLNDCAVEGFERIGNDGLLLTVGGEPYDMAIGRVRLLRYVEYGIVESSVVLWRCSMSADEPYPTALDVGFGVEGDFKGILPRHSTNPPGRPTMTCRLRVTDWTEHIPTLHISGPKLKFGPDAEDSITVTLSGPGAYDFVISGEIASEAMNDAMIYVRRDGPTGPICATGAVTVVWVDPITMRNGQGGAFSSDNLCAAKPIPPLLGNRFYSMPNGYHGMANIVEFRGSVHPASFPGPVNFIRDCVDEWFAGEEPASDLTIVINRRNISRVPGTGNDITWAWAQQETPSPYGYIYDYDTPGLEWVSATNQTPGMVLYQRLNFLQYAVCNGERCSDDFAWFSRLTFRNGNDDGTDSPLLWNRPGHSADNSTGSGHTNIGKDE